MTLQPRKRKSFCQHIRVFIKKLFPFGAIGLVLTGCGFKPHKDEQEVKQFTLEESDKYFAPNEPFIGGIIAPPDERKFPEIDSLSHKKAKHLVEDFTNVDKENVIRNSRSSNPTETSGETE